MTGLGIFKLYRYVENNLKQFSFQKTDANKRYLCQSWLNEDRLLIGTDSGKVLLFENGEVKAEFSVTQGSQDKLDGKILSEQ